MITIDQTGQFKDYQIFVSYMDFTQVQAISKELTQQGFKHAVKPANDVGYDLIIQRRKTGSIYDLWQEDFVVDTILLKYPDNRVISEKEGKRRAEALDWEREHGTKY